MTEGVLSKYTLYKNVTPTDPALDKLRESPYFKRVGRFDDFTRITYLCWIHSWAEQDARGQFEIVRGPHFVMSYIDLKQVNETKLVKLFEFDGIIVCMTFSRDLSFSKRRNYILSYSKEFFLCDAQIIEASNRFAQSQSSNRAGSGGR